MNKIIQGNLGKLKRLKQKNISDSTSQANKKRIDEIIKLYGERRITNITTAENFIKGLTSDNKRTYDKTFQKYKDDIKKFKESKPLNKRMNEAKEKNKEKTYLINFQIYTWRQPKNEKIKPAFKRNGISFYIDSWDLKQATIKTKEEFPKDVIKNIIFRYPDAVRPDIDEISAGQENETFKKLVEMLRLDEEFNDNYEELMRYYDNLFQAIKITSVELVDKKGEKFDITNENLKDTVHVSMFHKYVNTPVNMIASNLKEAIHREDYIKNECWINALLDFYGNSLMNEKRKNRLTREKVLEIIGRNDIKEKGITINEMEPVFKEFRITVRIFDYFNRLIYSYNPEIRDHHIKTFYAMVKNNHIYTFNNDLKSIQQKQNEIFNPVVKASTDYYLNEIDKPPKIRMINNVDEILKLEIDKDEKIVSIVLENNDLTEAFFQLVKSGYEPKITFQAGIITGIKLKLNKTIYDIKTQNLVKTSVDGCIRVANENTYNNLNQAMFNFNRSLFNPKHKSFYNDIDIAILNESRTIVPVGLLCDNVPEEIVEIDRTKAFTHASLLITEIPVFNQFDIWRVYTDEDINTLHELTIYYVEIRNELFNRKMMFNKKYSLIYGKFLGKVKNEKIKILYYKQPSSVHKCDYKQIISELWNAKISDDKKEDVFLKKLIANVNFGLLEKGGSTNQKSMVFRNLKEAVHYQQEYGGRLNKLSEVIDTVNLTETDDGCLQRESYECENESYYILTLKDKAMLKNGFRYIKQLLLDYHNFKMYEDYYKLKGAGINVYSVKNDAMTIDKKNLEKAQEILNFCDGIGGWRVNKFDYIKLPSVKYEIVKNDLIEIPVFKNEKINVKNEYDTDAIIDDIIEKNPVMIRGEVPGTGKSYICQKMMDRNYKVAIVCPNNRLIQEFEGEAMTTNKFFGISFGDSRPEPFDYSNYDVIVFDEVYFSDINIYWRIKQFVEQNKKDKIIIATGDCMQLKSIQPITNTLDYETYVEGIIDNIFEYNILLKECKRLNTQEDKDKLHNIKHDIFENKISVHELIKKYFKYTDDITSSGFNIAFLNNTCKNVSSEIRKKQNRVDEYECGERLICHEYTKINNDVFNVNFQYDIVKLLEGSLLLKNIKSGKLQAIPIEKVRKSFIFAFCATCHSAQGCSVDDDITIFDYKHFLVKNYPEWIFTALTRCRDLNRVKFFKYSQDKDDELNKKLIMSYFERKVENYKLQDRKAHRQIPKEGYVNADWFLNNIKNNCNYCGCGFHIDINKGGIASNLTCQRVDNELTHTLDNIIPYCVRCNCSCK